MTKAMPIVTVTPDNDFNSELLQNLGQSLRRYMGSGDTREAEMILGQLDKKPTLLGFFRRSKTENSLQKMNLERLAEIREHDVEIMNIHHEVWVALLTLERDRCIEIEKAGASASVRANKLHIYDKLVKIINQKTESAMNNIREAQKRMNERFRNDIYEAKTKYSDPEDKEFLERELNQIRKAMALHMQLTEHLFEEVYETLKIQATQIQAGEGLRKITE